MKKLLYLLLLSALCFANSPKRTILHCGELIDVNAGKVLKQQSILVEGNKIVKVSKGYISAEKGDEVIDLTDKTVLPGLLDMHVHLESELRRGTYINRYTLNEADVAYDAAVNARKTLMAGFTTVRELGGSTVNVALKKAINRGKVVGPRIYTAAKSIAITGGHADPTNGAKKGIWDYPGPAQGVADGVDECRKAVRQQVKNGADLIKITATGGVLSVARDGHRPQFTVEEIKAIVETANDFGIKVAAHAHGAEGMKRAILGGVSSIEHGTLMTEEVMDLMKEKGTWFVPTITAGKSVADSAKAPGFFPAVVRPKAMEIGPKIQSTFAKAYKRGVKIAFGTDAGVFTHGKNALEFQYMTEVGMPPMEAIQSATLGGSALIGIEDKTGSIEAGKWADIIAVDENPVKNIKALMDVTFVMKDGKVYKTQ